MDFAAGVNSQTVSLPVIIDDEVVELTEDFSLCIDVEHHSYHRGVVDLQCAQVFISDTDSECCSNTLCSIEHYQDTLSIYRIQSEHMECMYYSCTVILHCS